MTNSKSILVFLFAFLSSLSVSIDLAGQDIHFSQFDQAGFILNPAKVGSYYGSARVGGMYRDQFRRVSSKPYSTALLYVDSPISFVGKDKQSWLGVGAAAYVDRVGVAQLSTNSVLLSAGYHYALDTDYKTVISVAGSAGYNNRNNDLNRGDVFFEEEINGDGTIGDPSSVDRSTFANGMSYLDLGAGVMLQTRLNQKSALTVGSGLTHLNGPTSGFGEGATLPIRVNAHASLDYTVSNKLEITPRVLYSVMGAADQIQLQALAGYKMRDNLKLKGGLGSRFGDAMQIFIGAEFDRFDVGLGYDFTVSDLTNSTSGGALELAASYIFMKERKVQSTPKFICPQL